MEWIYLSPHLDDIALSCGGLVWEQSQAQQHVSIITICAGDPPPGEISPFANSLHARWETGPQAIAQRRQEDLVSCRIMGAAAHHMPVPDCIYRRGGVANLPLYASEESLTGPLHPEEDRLVDDLAAMLAKSIPSEAQVVSPLALGNHVDHNLTRKAAENLGIRLWYYADYPYVLKNTQIIARLEQEGWGNQFFPISAQGVDIWLEAIAAHASQISTFWLDLDSMKARVRLYIQSEQGIRLWKSPGKY